MLLPFSEVSNTSRRGVPSKVVSDNAKTFKSASKIIQSVFNEPEVTYDELSTLVTEIEAAPQRSSGNVGRIIA